MGVVGLTLGAAPISGGGRELHREADGERRSPEQHRFLAHDPHGPVQPLMLERVRLDTVQAHAPTRGLVEVLNQVEEGGLARPAATHQRHHRPWVHLVALHAHSLVGRSARRPSGASLGLRLAGKLGECPRPRAILVSHRASQEHTALSCALCPCLCPRVGKWRLKLTEAHHHSQPTLNSCRFATSR